MILMKNHLQTKLSYSCTPDREIRCFTLGEMYRILTEFKVFMYWKDPPCANRDAEPLRYDSYGRVFPVHEHRKTRLVSDLHAEESNLVVKSFKFDAMQ